MYKFKVYNKMIWYMLYCEVITTVREINTSIFSRGYLGLFFFLCVCVCVCVRERERENIFKVIFLSNYWVYSTVLLTIITKL